MGRLLGEPREDVGLESREKGEGNDERRDAENEPDERRRRDDPDLRVSARSEEVAAGQEELDQRLVPFGRMSGKSMTSRIEREFVKSMARRSMPTPSPAVGGIPYESAST